MRTILTISFLALACVSAFGQSIGLQAERNSKVEQELLKIEQEWNDVYKNGDAATLKRLLADDFSYTGVEGKIFNKEQYIAAVLKEKVESYKLSETAVRIYGETAILTAIWTGNSRVDGKDLHQAVRFTDVFVKRNGRWLAIASQETRLPTTTATVETGADAEQEVQKAHQAYDKAYLEQDAATLERLLAPDYSLIDPNGVILSKAQVVARAKAGAVKLEVGHSEDVKVRVYGNTALVTARWVEKSSIQGKPFVAGTLQNTIVYVKQNATWQVVSDQVTPILSPQSTR